MQQITVGKTKIKLDPVNTQISPLGREFRLSGTKIDLTKQPKYLDRSYKYCYWHLFIYTDTLEFFGFYFDENDKYLYKLTHKEVINL